MFGPDTQLIFGAMQMAAVVAGVTGGTVYLAMRLKRNKKSEPEHTQPEASKADLEERVRVLERIATDPATRLAEDFEALEKADTPRKERA